MAKGRKIYAPAIFIEEMDDLQQEQDIGVGSEVVRKMAKYARVGREVERIKNLDFRRLPTAFGDLPRKKKRGKKK